EMIATYRARAIAVIKELDRADAAPTNDKREKIEREVKARLAVEAEAKKRPRTKAEKAKAKEAT
ncbi:MAG: hypothetical protein JOZ59_06650, partial [Candidatus Eremiobacteraeota bacterium]|nr:hypothetical protein [Candidatus Eremiobacteraeota bacterium]